MPTWHITLTIPLVSENYPLDGLLGSDTAGSILVYGDSVDTNSDGFMDILLPDTLSDYPGGLYITLENDLPPITLPEDMFVIPGQDPMALGVGPISLGAIMPSELDSGITQSVDTTMTMSAMGLNMADIIIEDIPDARCDSLSQTKSDTIVFSFGNDPSDLNFAGDVSFPGYTKTINGSIPSTSQQGGCTDCGTTPETFVCDTSYAYTSDATVDVAEVILPTVHEGFAILPSPSDLPAGTPIESFESATISTGSISSTINNQLPLSASNLGLTVYTKKANGDTTTLHDHTFSTLAPYMDGAGASDKTSSLNGVALFDSLIFEFTGTIDSTEDGDTLNFPQGVDPFFQYSFLIDIDGFQSMQINMKDTTITFKQVMNTSSSDDGGQGFSVEIVSASFKDNVAAADTNRLSISIDNRMGLDISALSINLKNFYETQADLDAGVSETILFQVPDSTTADTIVVLNGHILSNTTGGDEPIDSLLIETLVQFSSGNGPTTILYPFPEEMVMDVNVQMTALRIEDLVGLFDISFEISEQEQPLSLPGLVGGITFGEAILGITLTNEFAVNPGLGLQVKGYKGDDSVVVVVNPDSVTFDAGSLAEPVETDIKISRDYVRKTVDSTEVIVQHYDTGDNIVNLMAMLPDRVSVGGDAQISPDSLSSITAGATISGKWRFEVPFLLSVAAGGVEFMPPNFSTMAALDSSTIEQLAGSNGIPDESDMLLSSTINTIIFNEIGLGFGLEILVSDLPYFPFYSSLQNKMLVSADLDQDGTADTLDLNLDSLIRHPMIKTLELQIPGGGTDPATGLVIDGMEGSGEYSYSADFNLDEEDADSTYGTLKHLKYAFLDTFMLTRSDTIFADVADALTRSGLAAPTVADSLYNLTLNENGKELLLMMDVSRYGELGWLIEAKDHYIATKFILNETPNPALLSFSAGIDVTAYMQFILNSAPIFSSAEEDTTQ